MGRWTAFGAVVALAALVAVPAVAADSKDKKKGPILRWAHTYEQAVGEAKERNCVIYVTIHAEHWGACVAQHRSVLDNDDFIAWSNENIVAVVGHNGATGGKEDHKPATEKDPKTKEEREICPVYPGLTCKEHQDLRAAFSNPPDGWGKIGQSDGVPNHWMVGPDGVCEKVENKDAALPKSLIEVLTAFQKKYEGKPVPLKKWDGYNKLFTDAAKAVEDGKWKVALAAYAKVDADGKKLSKGLVEKVAAKATELNDKVAAKFTEVKDGSDDDAAKLKAVKALRGEVGQKLSTGYLPVVAEMDAWLKEAATKPAPEPASAK